MDKFKQDFISTIAPYAVEDMMGTGVLASITLAQAILESNWGKAAPGNNLFGVKGSGQQVTTKEEINGILVTVVDGFAVYESWLDSIRGHSTFLLVNGRYRTAGFFKSCDTLDFVGAAKALQKAGYATDSHYSDKLVSIITTNNLHLFDKEAYLNMKAIDELKGQVQTLLNTADAHIEQINDLKGEVARLKENASLKAIPDWAKTAVANAIDSKAIQPDNAEGGSYDFYRLITILNRLNLL